MKFTKTQIINTTFVKILTFKNSLKSYNFKIKFRNFVTPFLIKIE